MNLKIRQIFLEHANRVFTTPAQDPIVKEGTMIDWARVRELRDEIGEEEFREVVTLFLDEMELSLSRLEPNPTAQRAESDLHFLKGSSLNLGFSDLASLCQRGEQAAAAGAPSTVTPEEVRRLYSASKAEFMAQMPTQLGV